MPRFPFRRSVGQDLRDLFSHDRLADQERSLGYSSISPGEGSADILDENGNEVARYGHHAGKAGFLVPDGAGWQTVQEAAAAAVAAGTAGLVTQATHNALAGRVGTAEGRLDSHASRLGAAENDITDLENTKVGFSTYNVLAGRVGALENDLGVTDGKLGTLSGKVTDLQNYVYSIHGGPVG